MKLNLLTQSLYTDDGKFLKKLHCPYHMDWSDMDINDAKSRKCNQCQHAVLDTRQHTEEELSKILTDNPDTCLKIDVNNENIKIINHGTIIKK